MHTHAHWAYTFIYFGIGRKRDGLSTRHSPAPLSLWSNHRPGLHRDHRGLGLHHWDGRATSGHRFDGRIGLETVDAAEGVENACWYTSRVHEGVQRACACVMRHKSKLLTHARAPATKRKAAEMPKMKTTIPCRLSLTWLRKWCVCRVWRLWCTRAMLPAVNRAS